jgi:hypothetical protein
LPTSQSHVDSTQQVRVREDIKQHDIPQEAESECVQTDDDLVVSGVDKTFQQELFSVSNQTSWDDSSMNSMEEQRGTNNDSFDFDFETELVLSTLGPAYEEHEIIFFPNSYQTTSTFDIRPAFDDEKGNERNICTGHGTTFGSTGNQSQQVTTTPITVSKDERACDELTVRWGNVSSDCIMPPPSINNIKKRQESFDSAAASLILNDLLCREDVRKEMKQDETDLLLDLLLLK